MTIAHTVNQGLSGDANRKLAALKDEFPMHSRYSYRDSGNDLPDAFVVGYTTMGPEGGVMLSPIPMDITNPTPSLNAGTLVCACCLRSNGKRLLVN